MMHTEVYNLRAEINDYLREHYVKSEEFKEIIKQGINDVIASEQTKWHKTEKEMPSIGEQVIDNG
ncbi:MAG: hypothetical protein II453_04785 [Alphaproteobacteria bacterium]|nr:hypothetical protein [Alphaproteobacteria bacterium]